MRKALTERESLSHPFPPFFDGKSRILILGSFPSVKSREQGFYYGHRQNRFWKVTSSIFGRELPETLGDKKLFLGDCRIALWDVIASCEICGSSDASIRKAVPNDMARILGHADIRAIFCNGRKAGELFDRYIKNTALRGAVTLPSTSPANAAWSLERLIDAWQCIRNL